MIARLSRMAAGGSAALMTLLLALPLLAQEAAPEVPVSTLDRGDTAWMLTSTALVLMMTIPGLALFYGGMVRKMNVLATVMQCFRHLLPGHHAVDGRSATAWRSPKAAASSAASAAFFLGGMEPGGSHPLAASIPGIGLHDLPDDLRHHHAGADRRRLRRPHEILAPCSGSWGSGSCSSMRRSPTWCGAGGLLGGWGVLDYAGGTVVHINAGVAGLVAALVLGKRKGYRQGAVPAAQPGATP